MLLEASCRGHFQSQVEFYFRANYRWVTAKPSQREHLMLCLAPWANTRLGRLKTAQMQYQSPNGSLKKLYCIVWEESQTAFSPYAPDRNTQFWSCQISFKGNSAGSNSRHLRPPRFLVNKRTWSCHMFWAVFKLPPAPTDSYGNSQSLQISRSTSALPASSEGESSQEAPSNIQGDFDKPGSRPAQSSSSARLE